MVAVIILAKQILRWMMWAYIKALVLGALCKQPLWQAIWVPVIVGTFATFLIQSVYLLLGFFNYNIQVNNIKGRSQPVMRICKVNSVRRRFILPTRTRREGPTLLLADVFLDVAVYLDNYDNTLMRFGSKELNGIIHHRSSALPLRVIAAVTVAYNERLKVYEANAFGEDLRTCWRDLIFDLHESPESMLREVLGRCKGFAIAQLELRDLRYTDAVMDAVGECLPFVTVSKVFVNGVASGHDQVHRLLEQTRGLRHVAFKNDAFHQNAAAVLSVCVARNVPNATLTFAADVTETAILDFLFENNSPEIARQFGIERLRRSLTDKFFELIVERCRRNECESLRFGLGGLLTDPTDAKYSHFIVEREGNAAMYRFDLVGQTGLPFTILVGKSVRFYLKVFQGNDHELCTSIEAAKKIPTWPM